MFGLNSLVGTVLAAGGNCVLNDGFDPAEVAELVARHRVTAMSCVPLQWKGLAALGQPGAVRHRHAGHVVGGARCTRSPSPRVEERLGLRLAAGFGLTETSGTICRDDPTDPHPGTVGIPLGDTEIRVVDDGVDALPGDYGEIMVKGPSVVRSYLDGSPTDLSEDGWLRTGDVGLLDDAGRLAIVDRSKDVINISGFNVSPAEVELALSSHPASPPPWSSATWRTTARSSSPTSSPSPVPS